MQHWVFSCAALFHEIQNISHEQALLKDSRWKKYVLWVAILALRKQAISILSLLLREQWLSDGSLPDINAVDFKFPANISIFLFCAIKSIDFCFLFSLNTS